MKELTYKVTFTTPAFLGNADQQAQWRTPPFKAQLRQWWRVAYAASKGYPPDVVRMREEEGRLFGNAWLTNNFSKSLVRVRLEHWSEGTLGKSQWTPLERVSHPEVKVEAPADLYLGYGPVTLPRGERNPTLKTNAAIQANEENTFSIACPEEHEPQILLALALMNLFGTVGGRSRNGWGSYSLKDSGDLSELPLREWKQCLSADWPHAIGHDAKGALIWQTQPFADWKVLMKQLAIIKIGLRTQFKFTTGKSAPRTEDRHWLSYPVTNHSVAAWGNNARLPNSLRFKVRPTADGKLVGVIFHMPCLPPPAFRPDKQAITAVWERVHTFLDQHDALTTRKG